MDDFNKAVGISLRFIHSRERFPAEIREHLASKGFASEVIDQTLDHLARKGVVSEERAVESRVRALSGRRAKGDIALQADLDKAGADPEIASQVILQQGDELARARDLLKVKFPEMPPPAKVARFLNARGFSEETIRSVLEDLGIDPMG